MRINVSIPSTPGNDRPLADLYPDAKKWHIDDEGRLHIVGSNGNGNIASYDSGRWASVEEAPPAVSPEAALSVLKTLDGRLGYLLGELDRVTDSIDRQEQNLADAKTRRTDLSTAIKSHEAAIENLNPNAGPFGTHVGHIPAKDTGNSSGPHIKASDGGAGVVKAAVERVKATTSTYNIGRQ